jgi:PAS domain S-box-containing protein
LRSLLVETLLQKGEIRDFEVKNVFPELGKKTWLVSAGQLSLDILGLPNILVSLKDITERTEAENILKRTNLELIELRKELEKRVIERTEELRRKEEFLRQAIRFGKFGPFEHDKVHEKIYWSKEQRTMLGFEERESYQFSDFASRIHPEDLGEVITQVAVAHNPEGPGCFAIEHRVLLPDGTIRWISHRSQTYFEGEGENRRAVRTIGVSLDITERKKAENLIKMAMERLAQDKGKLEESNRGLERFAAIAAHDLRAPIRSMGLWVEMLEDWVPKPWNQEIEQALHFIKFNSNKSLTLVQDLLEIARVKPDISEWETIDTSQLLNQILTTLKVKIETSQAKVTLDKLPEVVGIVWQVESVLSNLIRNALTYRESSKVPEIEIICNEKPECFLFQVKDNGIGIPFEFHKRIFEMFERLHSDEEYPGTGIGLSLCKKLVESWGGEMSLDSVPGKGSSFNFTYPKKEAGLARKSS